MQTLDVRGFIARDSATRRYVKTRHYMGQQTSVALITHHGGTSD